jgi:uncharacterized protein (DUF697 family)
VIAEPVVRVTRKERHMVQETTGSGTAEAKDPAAGTMTDAQRDEEAAKLVDRFSLWSGAAGLIPIPLVDIAAVGGVQLQMLRKLSDIYAVPFTENRGKSIIASLAGSLLPASAATTTAMGAASMVKFIPGVGTAVAALTMPVFSAGATYAIGKAFIQHFASGGTLLDFNPPDYREFIKAQKEKFNRQTAAGPTAAQPAPGPRSTAGKTATGS